MKPFSINHLGIQMSIQWEAMLALLLAQPLRNRAHLHGADAWVASLPLDLLTQAPVPTDGTPPNLRVGLDDELMDRIHRALEAIPLGITIVTTDPSRADLVRRLLPHINAEFTVRDEPAPDLTGASTQLLILDELDGPAPLPIGWDPGRVARLLVDEREAPPNNPSCLIPIRMIGDSPRIGQRPARVALRTFLQTAQGGAVLGRFSKSRLQWVLRQNWTQGETGVDLKLCYDGEVRTVDPGSLQLDIPLSDIPEERFADVSGHAAAIETLRSASDWLTDPAGTPGLKGFILEGPPGTGKSLLARAVAGEAAVPCFLAGAGEFLSMWYGESERRVREVLRAAGDSGSCVIVIDEFDAIAWRRDDLVSNAAAHQSTLVGELLAGLDHIRRSPSRVVFIATTNHFDRLDLALVRSMRLGDRIHLGHPSLDDRRTMFQGWLEGRLAPAEIDGLANLAEGLSQADLVAIATRVDVGDKIASDLTRELRSAIVERRTGTRDHSLSLSHEGRHRTAVHEAGHAIVAAHLLGIEQVSQVSIIPAVGSGLGAMIRTMPDPACVDVAWVRSSLAILMAGRAAEALVFPSLGATNGCELDLRQATTLAESAVAAWGMDPDFPLVSLQGLSDGIQRALAQSLVVRVQAWIEEADLAARRLVSLNLTELDRLAEELVVQETLSGAEVALVLDDSPKGSAQVETRT